MIFESLSVTKHMMLFFALSTTLPRVEFACTCTIESVCDEELLHVLELTNLKKIQKKILIISLKKRINIEVNMIQCVINAQ